MSAQVSLDLPLQPVGGDERTVGQWLTTFHLAAVVLDPYTYESAWILKTAQRILTHFRGADCRVAFIVAGTEDEARQFLGPIADEILTLCDPDRAVISGAELEQLPAFLHIAQDGTVIGRAEGWDPAAWKAVAVGLSRRMSWSYPPIPGVGDPVAYPGSPAAGAAGAA